MRNTGVSLIVSTYNWPQALKLCLTSVLQQDVFPDEIIIADDGSGNETKDIINNFKNNFSFPLKHVWQADEGHRLSAIRNKALAAASHPYIIQIDGDVVLDRSFIKDHLFFCRKGKFISGARALINEELTSLLIEKHDLSLIKSNKKFIKKKYNAFSSKLLSIINYVVQTDKRNINYVLGCNMAFWKKDILVVNGYNENFIGWGKEDNDIATRLQNLGIKLKFIKFGAIMYHLHHKMAERTGLSVNENLFKASISKKITYIKNGMDQYLTSDL